MLLLSRVIEQGAVCYVSHLCQFLILMCNVYFYINITHKEETKRVLLLLSKNTTH